MASSSSSPFISPSFLLFQQKLFPPIQTCYSWPLHPYLPFVFPSFSSILDLLVSVWIFKSQITANPQLPLPTVHLAFNCRVLLVQKKFQIRIWTSKKFDLVGFLLHRPRWCLFHRCISTFWSPKSLISWTRAKLKIAYFVEINTLHHKPLQLISLVAFLIAFTAFKDPLQSCGKNAVKIEFSFLVFSILDYLIFLCFCIYVVYLYLSLRLYLFLLIHKIK